MPQLHHDVDVTMKQSSICQELHVIMEDADLDQRLQKCRLRGICPIPVQHVTQDVQPPGAAKCQKHSCCWSKSEAFFIRNSSLDKLTLIPGCV